MSSLTLKPLKALMAAGQKAIDELLVANSIRQTKARADLELAKLDEKAITLERDIQALCVQPEINFTAVMSKMDDYDVNERRKAQLKKIVGELFPADQ